MKQIIFLLCLVTLGYTADQPVLVLSSTGQSQPLTSGNNYLFRDGANAVLGTTTGWKLGTTTSQKLGFWNATPIIQPVNSTAIDTVLTNTGLRESGGTANFASVITAPTVASGQESIILPHGAAPSAPTNGSMWSTSAGFYGRVNGVTVGPFLSPAGAVTSIAGTANEITASASTGAVTLSLPSALTFTGKTVTGGTLRLADGTAGAPTHSFASDTTSGMYLAAANTVGISANSVARLSVDSSGVNMFGTLTTGSGTHTFNGASTFASSITGNSTISGVVSQNSLYTLLANNTNSGNAAAVRLRACADVTTNCTSVYQYSSAYATTVFGVANPFNYGGLIGRGTTHAGLFIGEQQANAPIIFGGWDGAAETELARFTSGTISTGSLGIKYTTDSSSTTTGSITTLGGISYGSTKTMYGGNANFAGTAIVSSNGSAAAPAVQFGTTDVDGFYRVSSTAVGLSITGTAALFLGSSSISAQIASGGAYAYGTAVTDGSGIFMSGPSTSAGGQFRVYGSTHATKANYREFTRGATVDAYLDGSGVLTLNTSTDSTSTTTGAFTTLGGISYGATKTMYGGGANFASTVIAQTNEIVGATSLASDVTNFFGSTPYLVSVGNNSTAAGIIQIANGNNNIAAHIYGAKTRSTGTDADTIVQNNDGLANFSAYGSDGIQYRAAGELRFEVDGTPGSGDMPGRLVLKLTPDGASSTSEVMRVDNTGKMSLSATTDASSVTTGSFTTAGGLSVQKRSYLGTIGSTFSGNVSAGVQDGTAAVSGQVGEVIESTVSTATNAAATGTYLALTSVALTPGAWMITAMTNEEPGTGATTTIGGALESLIGTTSAASTGATRGYDWCKISHTNNSADSQSMTVRKIVNISSSTTYYLNVLQTYTAGTPQWRGSISAVRIR